jgi:hypothetical protein
VPEKTGLPAVRQGRKCIRLWPFGQSPDLPRPTKNLFLTLFLPTNCQKQQNLSDPRKTNAPCNDP